MGTGLILPGGGITMGDLIEIALSAERNGLDGVYVTEAWRSALVPLAGIAAMTERIEIGSYVANAYGRNPFVAGMAAVDLDELSRGRLMLGVGSGNRYTNAHYQGLEMPRPLTKMREYVELLQRIVAATPDDMVEYDGEIHHMDTWSPQVSPVRPAIPVLLAAIFPKMLGVAGAVADGVALGALLSTDYIKTTIRARIEAGAESADRDLNGFRWYVAQFVAVAENRDRARDDARSAICRLYSPKPHAHYDHLLRAQGYEAVADAVGRHMDNGDLRTATAAIPDEVVDTMTIAGTPDECRARIAEYEQVADQVLLVNVGSVEHRRREVTEDEHERIVGTFQELIRLIGSR